MLTLLDKTTAQTAMTQMVGRVLRQPEARSTPIDALNQCYVFCYDQDVNTAVDNVRKGLEEGGMTGLSEFVQAVSADGDSHVQGVALRFIPRRDKFKGLKIFLPRVLHKEGNNWRDINYDHDILSYIPWHELTYDVAHFLDDKDAPLTTETRIDVREQPAQDELELIIKTQKQEVWVEKRLDIAFLSRPLMDVIPNPWQAARLLLETIKTLNDKGYNNEAIYNSRLYLLERMKQNIKRQVHEYSEKLFKDKLKNGDIIFRLITQGNEHLNFEIAHQLKAMARHNERKLFKESYEPIENSLFEVIFEKDLNHLEKNFALYLADSDAVTWWHRMVARQDYALQGWQRNKIYPDFIACLNENRLLIMETKGLQLKGNDDTVYKTRLFDLLTNYYHPPFECGYAGLKSR